MRHHPRRALVLLAVVQGLLLYLTASRMAGGGGLYGCSLLCGHSDANILIPLIATAFGVAIFILPTLIGALCHSWQGAIALAVAPWWVAVVAHAGTMLAPYIGLGQLGGRFDPPFWLNASHVILLLLSLALFAALGYFGWLVQHAIRSEFIVGQPA